MRRATVASVIKERRRWLVTIGDKLQKRASQKLRESLEDGTLRGLRVAAIQLDHLGMYSGVHGCVSVLDNDDAGYDVIGRALTYYHLALLIEAKSFSTTSFLRNVAGHRDLTLQCGTCSCLLCYGIACTDSVIVDDCGGILHAMIKIPGALYEGYWKARTFEPFAVRMYFEYRGMNDCIDHATRDYGVYAAAAASLTTDSPLTPMDLERMCDYHCANMVDSGGRHFPEFSRSPFDLIPFEILALRKLHANKEFEFVPVEHPILSGPLAEVERIRRPADPVATQVKNVYRAVFGVDV